MYKLKLFSVFLLLSTVLCATNVGGVSFENSIPDHFNTDLQFTTDITLSVSDPDDVSSGNPNDLQAGDTICSGARVTITPTVNARWAVTESAFAVQSLYPSRNSTYCPSPGAAVPVTTNAEIGWLSASVFNEHVEYFISYGEYATDFADNYALPETQEVYNDLISSAPLEDQPVTYRIPSRGLPSPGPYLGLGHAGVYCRGDIEVADSTGGRTVNEIDSMSSAAHIVRGSGSAEIETTLQGVDCFAVVMKDPPNIADHEPFFRLYYYTGNRPSIPATVGRSSITINVAQSGGECRMRETHVDASFSRDEDYMLVDVTMRNTGDSELRVTGVTSSDDNFVVDPFPVGICDALGFQSAVCPDSNGFDSDADPATIPAGEERLLFVLVERLAGATGGTVLNFEASTVSAACGGAGSCSDTVNLRGPISCEIEPPALDFGPYEIAGFEVSCENPAGDPTPCVGDDWSWGGGLEGEFIERNNTHAIVYPTSPEGSNGTLRYESNLALCHSDITLIEPRYRCEFIPPSADMDPGEYQYFDINCFVDDSASEPDNADYDLLDGLDGTLAGSSTDGTGYLAPDDNSSGSLRGAAYWDDTTDDPILGAVAFAPIDVGDTGGIPTEGDYEGEGATEHCTIGDGSLDAYPGFSGWVSIMCGPLANETCSGVHWGITQGGYIIDSDDHGASFVFEDSETSGRIVAYMGSPQEGRGCSLPFSIGSRDCIEFS